MTARITLASAAITGMTAVLLGAFGAHGLKPMLSATGRLDVFNLAVEYQFYHALALLGTGLISMHYSSRNFSYAAIGFLTGVFFFSGSLYLLAVLDQPVLGAVTPIGGLCFIAGWVFLLIGILKNKKASQW